MMMIHVPYELNLLHQFFDKSKNFLKVFVCMGLNKNDLHEFF